MNDLSQNYLLDAVDALTIATRSKVMQDDADTGKSRLATVELPPLLTRLQNAIRGTIGKGGSGSLASERSMLDSDALFRFMRIASTIQDWARIAGADINKTDPAATLRAWYVIYRQKNPSLESERFHTRELQQWAFQINAKLDPPRVLDLPFPCPECGAKEYWDPEDKSKNGRPRPLVIEYRETGPDLVQQAIAKCRSCDTRWGIRELAYQIELHGGQHQEATA